MTCAWPETIRPLHGGWYLTTEHSASSCGIPVLVSPLGETSQPGDLLSVSDVADMRGIAMRTLSAYLSRKSPSAGIGWHRIRIGTQSYWAVTASDALRSD